MSTLLKPVVSGWPSLRLTLASLLARACGYQVSGAPPWKPYQKFQALALPSVADEAVQASGSQAALTVMVTSLSSACSHTSAT